MRQLAGGVAIVTAGAGDLRSGFTASSVTSLTLDPPCILACVNRQVTAWSQISADGRFCVNLLADRHEWLAARFAGRGGFKGSDRFREGTWRIGGYGMPVLADALASIECELEDAIERHSHMILIGAVRSLIIGAEGSPLLYSQGGFGRFEPL